MIQRLLAQVLHFFEHFPTTNSSQRRKSLWRNAILLGTKGQNTYDCSQTSEWSRSPSYLGPEVLVNRTKPLMGIPLQKFPANSRNITLMGLPWTTTNQPTTTTVGALQTGLLTWATWFLVLQVCTSKRQRSKTLQTRETLKGKRLMRRSRFEM